MKTSYNFPTALLLMSIVLQINFANAQTYANDESHGANLTCIACVVVNAENSVDEDEETYATASLTVGVAGAYVYQKMQFPGEASHGEYLSVVVEGPGVGSLDDVALACLEITTYNNGASNNDSHNSSQFTIEQIGASSKYIVKMQPSATFDEVEIKMVAGSIGAVTQLRIYFATFSILPLPVELVYFKAASNAPVNELEWSTASEKDSDYFTIERSINGIHFQEVAKVKAAGNSTSIILYHFNDENPLSGNNYYRLKQTDMNDQFQYSPVISVQSNRGYNEFSIAPNPVSNFFNLSCNLKSDCFVDLKIMSLDGICVYNSTVQGLKGENVITINDLGDIHSGIYQLYVFSNNEIISKRLVKM